MSLINDALKRAKQAQKENPPPTPALQFRPVEPGQEARPRSPMLIVGVILGLIVMVGLGGLLLWAVAQNRDAGLQAEARTLTEGESAKPGALMDPPPAPLRVEPTPAPVTTPEEAMTNTQLAVAVVEAPKVPELKLQGIFFNPRSPSAVVNGKTVYVGDKVSGFRVLAITPEAVKLANATATNVLSLSE
jgi:hypothetical protein